MSQVRLIVTAVLVVGLAAGSAVAGDSAPLLAHRAHLKFATDTHRVDIQDEVDVPAGLADLRLGVAFTVTGVEVAGRPTVDLGTVLRAASDEDGPFQLLDLTALGLSGGGTLRLTTFGVFNEAVDDVVFSRENVGGEITATISEAGIYLSSAAEWLVWQKGSLATYDLALETPAGFETVTQGARTRHTETPSGLQTRWVTRWPSDGINLIANRYVVHEEPVREGVVSMTFFLADDARLRATYTERTAAYLAMYEEMIGPYPYAKFATVENWFPTGYGMPSYTLLGGQILRLPFIPYTSFGHEIAHNWWGNSVFVDTEEGNWCEGLTVYCADYHYKELESEEAARAYRRVILKDYAAYVQDPVNDFPLSQFLSRHSGASRAVGYGKSMMVFHMVEEMIGREAFRASLRAVAAEHQFAAASWSDFMAAFAAESGQDFADFSQQWLTRTGAPTLDLGRVDFGADRVQVEIRQTEPLYDLQVPVVVTAASGVQEHVVQVRRSAETFTFKGKGIRQVAIDPDDHVFRRLHPQEIEATITQVLAEAEPVFVMGADEPMMQASSEAFAAAFAEDEDVSVHADGKLVSGGHTNIVINPDMELFKKLAPPELQLIAETIFLAGKRYPSSKYDLVFAAPDPEQSQLTHLVVMCRSPRRLEGLANRVSHYGKYSWLVLPAGSGRPVRGNWTPGDSPLVRVKGQ